jgi:hypothetical protein
MMKNYFKILNLEPKLLIDHNELKKQYFTLIKKTPTERVDIEKAYQTLKERLSRIEHLLMIQGRELEDLQSLKKIPKAYAPLVGEVDKALAGPASDRLHLKQLHDAVLREFSTASIGLATLEKEWDEKGEVDTQILDKLKNQWEVFCYIRGLEQNVRRFLA